MKKPAKKQIDDLAKKLREVFLRDRPAPRWLQAAKRVRDDWRRVAEYVLADYTRDEDYKMPPFMGEAVHQAALKRRRQAKRPKSCRLVDGKVVCK